MASKRQLELSDALASLDSALTEQRSLMDSYARGRKYKEFAEVAAKAGAFAAQARDKQAELDKILTEEWEKRRGG